MNTMLGFTALDLLGPATAWGMLPGAEFQTIWRDRGSDDLALRMVKAISDRFTMGLGPGSGRSYTRAISPPVHSVWLTD